VPVYHGGYTRGVHREDPYHGGIPGVYIEWYMPIPWWVWYLVYMYLPTMVGMVPWCIYHPPYHGGYSTLVYIPPYTTPGIPHYGRHPC